MQGNPLFPWLPPPPPPLLIPPTLPDKPWTDKQVQDAIIASRKEYTEAEVTAAIDSSHYGGKRLGYNRKFGNRPDYILKFERVMQDTRYWGVDADTWNKIIVKYNGSHQVNYMDDVFDCDNYALLFSATTSQKWAINGAGIVIDYSGAHAYNLLLVKKPDGSLKLQTIEPQGGSKVTRAEGSYKGTWGMLIFA